MEKSIAHHHFRFFLALNLCFAGFLLAFVINQALNGNPSHALADSQSSSPSASWESEGFGSPPTGNLPALPVFPGISKVTPNAPITVAIKGSSANGISINLQADIVSYLGVSTGGAVNIYWTSTGATSCQAIKPDGSIAHLSLSGSWNDAAILPGAGAQTYTFICSGSGGSASSSVVITPGSSVSASDLASRPAVVISGTLASTQTQNLLTLTWSSTNGTACTASGAWSGSQPLSGTSVQTLDSATVETFTITCVGSGGTGSASVTVQPPQGAGTSMDLNNLFGISKAYAQDINDPTNGTPCSYIASFASSCITPSDPTTDLVSFSGGSATANEVSFALTEALPPASSATSSLLWNTGYYWSQLQDQWIRFTFKGSLYNGTSCSSSSGCWLGSSGLANISVASATALNGSLFILTYDAQWINGSWQGSSCVNGTGVCWRISVYPPTATGVLIQDAKNSIGIQSIISTARNAGYFVQTASNSNGTPSVVVEQPFTHEVIVSGSGPED